MHPRSFLKLFWVTVVGIVLAVIAWVLTPSYSSGYFLGQPVFDKLIDRVNDVSVMSIEHAGQTKTFMKDDQGEWYLMEAQNYPADKTRIRNTLIGLARLEKVEPKTLLPEFYPDISVEDNALSTAKSYLVTLLDDQGTNIASLLVGKTTQGVRWDGKGFFVRFPEEAQSWLVRGVFDVTGDSRSWILTRLFPLTADQISSITVLHQKREITFGRVSPDAPLSAVFLSDPYMQTSTSFISDMVSSLTSFDFIDVIKKPFDLNQATIFDIKVVTKSGLEIFISFFDIVDRLYAQVGFTSDGSLSSVEKESQNLQKRHQEWLYQVPVGKVAVLLPFFPIPEPSKPNKKK